MLWPSGALKWWQGSQEGHPRMEPLLHPWYQGTPFPRGSPKAGQPFQGLTIVAPNPVSTNSFLMSPWGAGGHPTRPSGPQNRVNSRFSGDLILRATKTCEMNRKNEHQSAIY